MGAGRLSGGHEGRERQAGAGTRGRGIDHTGDAPGDRESLVFLPPPDGCSAMGENPDSEQHSLVQAHKSRQETHGQL